MQPSAALQLGDDVGARQRVRIRPVVVEREPGRAVLGDGRQRVVRKVRQQAPAKAAGAVEALRVRAGEVVAVERAPHRGVEGGVVRPHRRFADELHEPVSDVEPARRVFDVAALDAVDVAELEQDVFLRRAQVGAQLVHHFPAGDLDQRDLARGGAGDPVRGFEVDGDELVLEQFAYSRYPLRRRNLPRRPCFAGELGARGGGQALFLGNLGLPGRLERRRIPPLAAGEVLLRLGQAFLLWVTSSGSTGAL